jgi:3'-5' exoribonuclease
MADGKSRIEMLEAGNPVSAVFLLKEKRLGQSKSGGKYLTLFFSDRGGEIEGKLWDEAELVNSQLEASCPVRVEGVVSLYKDKKQITVRTIRTQPWDDALLRQLLPISKLERRQLEAAVDRLLATIRNPHLRRLTGELRGDGLLMERFFSVPAAKMIHHAYVRGLAEHTASVMEICGWLAEHYAKQFPGQLDRDMLLAGAFLHDLGKTKEYEYERGLDLTPEGRLIGHMVLGIEILAAAVARIPGFPADLANRLRHMVVSHHGEHEMGAPVVPVTIEAQLLHLVDYLDSQTNAVGVLLDKAQDEDWTAYSQKFERRFLRPGRAAPAGPVASEKTGGAENGGSEDGGAPLEVAPTEEAAHAQTATQEVELGLEETAVPESIAAEETSSYDPEGTGPKERKGPPKKAKGPSLF